MILWVLVTCICWLLYVCYDSVLVTCISYVREIITASLICIVLQVLNTLRPRQNGHHFPYVISNGVFNENIWISIKISLKFVTRGQINNSPSLVQIMAWRRPGDKPLSEPMMVSLLTHVCVTRPQWVNSRFRKIHLAGREWPQASLICIMLQVLNILFRKMWWHNS